MKLYLPLPKRFYDPKTEHDRNAALERALARVWSKQADVDHPHSMTVRGREIYPFQTLSVDDTTPDVSGGRNFRTANTVPTSISDFDGATDGQVIFIAVNDSNTTFDFTGSGLWGNGGADLVAGTGDSVTCVYDATSGDWFCSVATG